MSPWAGGGLVGQGREGGGKMPEQVPVLSGLAFPVYEMVS